MKAAQSFPTIVFSSNDEHGRFQFKVSINILIANVIRLKGAGVIEESNIISLFEHLDDDNLYRWLIQSYPELKIYE